MIMLQNCAFYEFKSEHQSPRKQSIECLKNITKALNRKKINHKIIIHKRTGFIFRYFKHKNALLVLDVYERKSKHGNRMSLTCQNKVNIGWNEIFKPSRLRIDTEIYPGEALVGFHKEVQDILKCDSRFSNIEWLTYIEWHKAYYDEDISDWGEIVNSPLLRKIK